MSSTNNESVNAIKIRNTTQHTTPIKQSTHTEPKSPIRNDQNNDKLNYQEKEIVEELKKNSIEESIVIPKIQRLPFNIDKDEGNDSKEKGYEYIHYCGNKDCEWDCGVLDCGCIDTCRNRCGTRQMFDFD
jgi:hypothetical protein